MGLSVFRGISVMVSGRVAMIFAHVLITPLLVRALGGDFGNFTFIISVMTFTILFHGAMNTGLRKYISERRATEGWQSQVFGFYVRVSTSITVGVLALVVIAIESGFVARVLDPSFELYFYLMAGMILLRNFMMLGQATLEGSGKEHISETLNVAHRIGFGVVAIGLSIAGFGLFGVLLGDIIVTFVVVTLFMLFARRYVSFASVVTLPPESFPRREVSRFNGQSLLLSVLILSLYHVDILMLRLLTGSEVTGHYKAALLVAEFLWVAPIAIQNALVHTTSELWSLEEHERIQGIAAFLTRYTTVGTTFIVVLLVPLAGPFVTMYFGADYAPAALPLLILLPGALGFAIAKPLLGIGRGKGDIHVLIHGTAVAAGLNVLLNFLLIPRYGMYGAAVATSVGYGTMVLAHVWGATRMGFNPVSDMRLGRLFVASGLTLAVILPLSAMLPTDALRLVLIPVVGVLVFWPVAITTGLIDRAELTRLGERFAAFIPRSVVVRWQALFG
ncbi:oligosaccharide flippase family protein [Haladaptatus sp. DYSN1]|uniref:oligosaccharide flippase family protein n=1 Tax=unclassified Haladaptatus TaxID=2622732 RepID=UPI00240556F5|nr:oligosaccharide flippase family protein [Haladaptatus sp. DYSN1]